MRESMSDRVGALRFSRALDHPDLLAAPVLAALSSLHGADHVGVAEIDPSLSDTAAFCDRYGVRPDESANCVVVAGRRQGTSSRAACVVLATTRADVNGVVRRRLGARKVSFADVHETVADTGMEYGGITPIGLPEGWPVLVDEAVARHPRIVVGSGLRSSKLLVPGRVLSGLPHAEVIAQLGG